MEKQKILVSDDDDYIVDFLSHVLKSNGYEVLIARDGLKTLEMTEKGQPQLLILDVMLPKLNAMQICQHLNKEEQTKKIPKIVMTASINTDIEKDPSAYNVKLVIKKPFMANDLLNKIQWALSDGRPGDGV